MKHIVLLLVVISGLFAQVVVAVGGDQYLLPKIGFMVIDNDDKVDALISVGLLYGYGLSDAISAEAELNYGFSGGEFDDNGETRKYRISTAAGYGVYRLPVTNSSYLKGKLGLLYESIKKEPGDAETTTDFGIAGGVGFGFQFGKTATLDLEVTIIDKDIIFYSLGAHYRF